mgnify:CR=1
MQNFHAAFVEGVQCGVLSGYTRTFKLGGVCNYTLGNQRRLRSYGHSAKAWR